MKSNKKLSKQISTRSFLQTWVMHEASTISNCKTITLISAIQRLRSLLFQYFFSCEFRYQYCILIHHQTLRWPLRRRPLPLPLPFPGHICVSPPHNYELDDERSLQTFPPPYLELTDELMILLSKLKKDILENNWTNMCRECIAVTLWT